MAKKKQKLQPKEFPVPDELADRFDELIVGAKAEKAAIDNRLNGRLAEWVWNAQQAAGVPSGSDVTYDQGKRAFVATGQPEGS